MDCLNVYLCGRLAGFLERDGKTVSFRYSPDYLSDPEAMVISSTLPLSADRFEERDVMAFFSNLLPDEGVRRRIAEILRLSPDDTFGLLRAIGGDCAGAVAFWEPGKEPSCIRSPKFRELSESEADALLSNLANRPLGIADDFRGISGAGAQDKLIACWKDGKVLLPLCHDTIRPGIEGRFGCSRSSGGLLSIAEMPPRNQVPRSRWTVADGLHTTSATACSAGG